MLLGWFTHVAGAGSDAAASRLFGRDHDARHADCRDAVDRLCMWLTAQTQPADRTVADQREVMRMLVGDVLPALARDDLRVPSLEPAG